MPPLELPHFAATPCEELGLNGAILLGQGDLEGLLAAVASDKKDVHAVVRRFGTEVVDGVRMGVSERFGVDPLDDEEQKQRLVEALKPSGLQGPPVGLLHVDLELAALDGGAKPKENLKDQELVTRFWGWAQQRGGVEVWVRASMSFDPADNECIIGLPLRVPVDLGVFDSIPGLILTKSEGEGVNARNLYEVLVRQDQDELAARVNFRSRADGATDMLRKLLIQATDVAHFAVHEKAKGASAS